ncbi:MAG: hypothetical protein ACLQF1_02185 [Methyloceanibacter sp.]|jgi:hypothetical protein
MKDLPADDLQAVDFQVLDGRIARDQCHAKSLGVGCRAASQIDSADSGSGGNAGSAEADALNGAHGRELRLGSWSRISSSG